MHCHCKAQQRTDTFLDHPPTPAMWPPPDERSVEERESLVALRRDLHRHPELGFEEVRTQATLRAGLEALGFTPTPVAGTGLVCDLRPDLHTENKGMTIAIRAEMDALPMQEAAADADLPYKSRTPGVMHACGHDGHCKRRATSSLAPVCGGSGA